MSVTSYSELQTAAANWLGRDDLTARIPEFITFAEAKLNRELRSVLMETRSTTTVDTTHTDPEFISLPGDFQKMVRVRLSSVNGKPRLEFLPGNLMDEARLASSNASQQPKFFNIVGNELELYPTPDANYTIEMLYRAYIPALSNSNATNWLLTLAPDVYLYGTLLEAGPYMQDDNQTALWATAFKNTIDSVNNLSLTQKYNTGPLIMRNSGINP